MRKNVYTYGLITAALTALIGFFAFSGCGQADVSKEAPSEEIAVHDHGEEKQDRPLSIEEVAAARCEHGTATYLCSECRYEVGVVKVPGDLCRQSPADTGGLLVTETVENRRVNTGLRFTGEIQLNENEAVHLSPRIAGIIEHVYVDIGERVRRGDQLFRINSVELGTTLAAYELSRSLTELSQKNFEREKLLRDQNISSEQDLIEAQMIYETHKTELKAAAEALRILGITDGDLHTLREQQKINGTGSLPVRASIAGTVIQKHAVVGELVEPGTDVLLLADLSSVWVWADIYEKDLPRLLAAERDGPIPVRIYVKAFPDHVFDGSIDYLGATMDERTRTVKVRATVANAGGHLRPGMFCEVHAGIMSDETALSIQRSALLSDEGDEFVFAFWKDDFFVRRSVKTGRTFFDMIEVLEGLRPGDRIVTEGAFLLKSDVLREKMGAGCAD